ncbi:MAG TPA: energy transducer TonB [Vicinamibacterales bacterium]|nr:energy transducer TonB [Vicinamibacterales bacterium]
MLAPLLLAGLVAQGDAFTAGVYQPADVSALPKVRTKAVPLFVDGVVKGPAGQLRIDIVIDAKGSVKAARIARALAGRREYDADALEAAKDWKFVPGQKDGKAVPVLATIVIDVAMRPLGRAAGNEIGLGARVFIEGADDEFAQGASTVDDVGTMPKRLKSIPPNYPVSAMKAGQGGEVLLEAVVLPDGTVGRARVVRSVDIQLDKAALTALKQWVYEPPTKNGQPTSVLLVVIVNFAMRPPAVI